MNNLTQWALSLISRRPDISQNPRAQEMIRVIQNGDEKRGIEIASNLCNTYGMDIKDAYQSALNFFTGRN